MDDGSRSTGNIGEEKEHKAAKVLLKPLCWLNKKTTGFLRRALGANYADVTEDEVMDLVDALAKDEEEGGIEEDSAQMISNVFEFAGLTAGDVMTHRTSIVGVDINTITLDDLIYLALDMGFSRIPVYEDSVDKIIGIIIVKDLLCLIGKPDLSDFNTRDFVRDVSFIPEACSCSDTFKTLTKMKAGMAVVVDEYGGTAGIVTLEDIIEAVMGNIQDEYDDEKAEITRLDENTYEVLGDADPDDVFALFGVTLPEDHEYETIAGFVTDKLGYIPEGADIMPPAVEYEGVKLVVTMVEDRNILKIRATKLPQSEEEEE
ncbi:MAG: HlyC/CorC family transporter [Oscillospiraceae bacterium]|nr:HlyC/CorC family transporter [Oscillospiraceae bacterium]